MNRAARFVTAARFVSTISLALFAAAIAWQFVRAFTWGRADWGMTDWLIDYAGGFVRRGLPGAVLFHVASATGFPANALAVVISYGIFFAVLAIFVARAKGKMPLFLIVSPALLAAPAYEDFIVRKDILGILLLAACLALYQGKWLLAAKTLAVNVVAVIAVLSHETFLFFAFPVLLLMQAGLGPSGEARRLALGVLALGPVLAAFALTTVFHGNPHIAQAVNDSWSGLWTRINPADCCIASPGAAIDALQWSTGQALSYSARLLSDFSFGIYVPAAWAVTVLLCLWFMIGFQDRAEDARRLAAILVLQLAAISPLFVLGWDFGRWIFLWTASSLMIHLSGVELDFAIVHKLTDRPAAALAGFCLRRRPQPWQLLVFGVPSCCWNVATFAMSTPPGFAARAVGLLK